MPNYDAGHYFLTVLAPIKPGSVLVNGQSQSHRHAIRDALSVMPGGAGFAGNTMTHFARFSVLDDTVFNGRVARDTLVSKILKINPLTPQPVDRLSTPYLIFTADFDAASGDQAELRKYLTVLWDTMSADLTGIFQHCLGFDASADAERFFNYILRCQVETTMPFNDYWSTPPDMPDLNLQPYVFGGGAALVAVILGIFFWRPWLAIIGLVALAAIIFLAYQKVVETAQIPFPKSPPPGPPADLPTVLKALQLQRAFTEFAIKTQGKTAAEVCSAFGDFITENQPDDVAFPTQSAGVIGV